MEATVGKGKRSRRKVTRGGRQHWAVCLAFGIVFGILLIKAFSTVSSIIPQLNF